MARYFFMRPSNLHNFTDATENRKRSFDRDPYCLPLFIVDSDSSWRSFYYLKIDPLLRRYFPQFSPLVPIIYPHLSQCLQPFRSQQLFASMFIAFGRARNMRLYEKPFCVDCNVSFPPFDFFARVISTEPPFSVVFTL